MKKSVTLAAALLAGLVSVSTAALAGDAEQAFKKCKADAEADEVALPDQKLYVSNCMKELGISAEDVNKVVNNEISSTDEETAKAK